MQIFLWKNGIHIVKYEPVNKSVLLSYLYTPIYGIQKKWNI